MWSLIRIGTRKIGEQVIGLHKVSEFYTWIVDILILLFNFINSTFLYQFQIMSLLTIKNKYILFTKFKKNAVECYWRVSIFKKRANFSVLTPQNNSFNYNHFYINIFEYTWHIYFFNICHKEFVITYLIFYPVKFHLTYNFQVIFILNFLFSIYILFYSYNQFNY